MPLFETHYMIEPVNAAWQIVTIYAGCHAIGEFMMLRRAGAGVGASPRRNARARFVYMWGVRPPKELL